MNKFYFYLQTIKYLKPRQIFYQIKYRLRKRRLNSFNVPLKLRSLSANFPLTKYNSFSGQKFTFLGEEKKVPLENWVNSSSNYLWNYNLNYFDYINSDLDVDISAEFINKWIKENIYPETLPYDPYPTSLRICNWIKFFLNNSEYMNSEILKSLGFQTELLFENIEFHIDGNHLFTNAKALYFSSIFIDCERSEIWRERAVKILNECLENHFYEDGCYFERSPTYQLIICEDLLDLKVIFDCLNGQLESDFLNKKVSFIAEKAFKFTQQIFLNQDTPLFNDSVPDSHGYYLKLLNYAQKTLGKKFSFKKVEKIELTESNFLIVNKYKYELIANCFGPSPSFQPGHFHDGIFAFEAWVKGRKIITNLGISTYENNETRLLEKSSKYQNVINIDGSGSALIWSSFRLANRPYVEIENESISDGGYEITFRNDGFKNKKVPVHYKKFKFKENSLFFEDKFKTKKNLNLEHRIFLESNVGFDIESSCIMLDDKPIIKVISNSLMNHERVETPFEFGKYKNRSLITMQSTDQKFLSFELKII